MPKDRRLVVMLPAEHYDMLERLSQHHGKFKRKLITEMVERAYRNLLEAERVSRQNARLQGESETLGDLVGTAPIERLQND